MTSPFFKITIASLTGEEWELPYKDFSFTEELNNDKYASVNVDYENLKDIADDYGVTVEYILSATYRELYIYDDAGTKIYGGYVSELTFNAGSNELGALTISSKGFFSLLHKRFTDDGTATNVTSTDASVIARGLITYTQALPYGDFGITLGANPTTKDRDRTFKYSNIGEEIQKLSANNLKDGFDFEITADKVFNVYYPLKGSELPNIILQEGFNVESFTIIKHFIDAMTNQVIVAGAGLGEAQNIVVRDADASYKSSFYLLQDLLTENDVEITTTLEDKGDKHLDRYKYPRVVVQTLTTDYDEPDYNLYNLGDSLKIKIPSFNIDGFYRVYKRTVRPNKVVTLEFQEI